MASSSGDRNDHKSGYGRDNFRGPGPKRNSGIAGANSSPWTGARDNGADPRRSKQAGVVKNAPTRGYNE